MNIRISALSLILGVSSAAGFAQTVKPSITLGTHILTLGMPDTVVLQQLGTDLELRPIGGSGQGSSSSWGVSKKIGSVYQFMGSVDFDASHRLEAATRSWEVEDTSSKSLFYALSEASRSIEHDGLTACHVSTTDENDSVEGGSITMKKIEFDCGVERIWVVLTLSDSASVSSGIEVTELLDSKWTRG